MPRSFDTHALRQAGFSLQPLPSADEGSWWQGTHRGSNRGVIVRVAPAAPFAEAVVEAAGLIDLMDSGPVGIASPLAVVVCCRDGRLAAATAAAAAGFSVAADPAVAATLAEDEPVDVCVVYDAAGAAALDAAAVAPTADLVAASARPTARVTETTPATDDAGIAETQTIALEPRTADAARPPAQVFAPKTAPLIPADNSSVGSSTATGRLASGPYRSGDVILPGYRLVRQLGKGGFGEVWKATAPGGMGVAIKVISNLGRREGAREYRALRTVKDIRHAHIVPMFGVWLKTSDGRLLDEEEAAKVGGRMLNTDPGQRVTVDPQAVSPLEHLELVIAMGLGDQTLFDRLRVEPEGLEIGRLLGWMRQAALAIDHFNRGADGVERMQAAVQHCDIKPQNILLVGNAVQVCDFGLARVQGEVRATANNLLSIAYAAPEMTQRPYDPSPATDQYSLAVTYHELRTGRLPYAGPSGGAAKGELSAFELLRAKAEGRFDLDMVSRGEEQVLRRAMSTDPAERFGSCEEFIDALDNAVKRPSDGETGPGQSVATPFPWLKGGMLGAGTLAALGVAAVLFLLRFWPGGDRDGDGRGIDTGNGISQQTVTVQPIQDPPPDSLDEARTANASDADRQDIRSRRAFAENRFADAAEDYVAFRAEDPKLRLNLWDLHETAIDAGKIDDAIRILALLEPRMRNAQAPLPDLALWEVLAQEAWLLACGPRADDESGRRAVALATEALGIEGSDKAQVLDSLAAGHARVGQWDDAVKRIQQAIEEIGDADFKKTLQRRADSYRRRQPWSQLGDEPSAAPAVN